MLTGDGVTMQLAWLSTRMIEPAVRYSVVSPHSDIAGLPGAERQRQVSAAITRYLKGHRVKLQAEILRDDFRDALTRLTRGTWSLRTSIETGI